MLKMEIHKSSEKHRLRRSIGLIAGLSTLLSVPFSAKAQNNDWWFEIEVILFKRAMAVESVDEQFNSALIPASTNNQFDLLSPFLTPDITLIESSLPLCTAPVTASASASASASESEPDQAPASFELSVFTPVEQLLDPATNIDALTQDLSWQTGEGAAEYLIENIGSDHNGRNDAFDTADNSTTPFNTITATTPNTLPQSAFDAEKERQEKLSFLLTEGIFAPLQKITIPDVLLCRQDEEPYALTSSPGEEVLPNFVEAVPARINGIEWPYDHAPYLISASSLQLTTLARDIARQRGVDGLLHMGWRQKVLFGQGKAPSMHLYAGNNYADEFDVNGKRLIETEPTLFESEALNDLASEPQSEEDLLTRISQALSDPEFKIEQAPEEQDITIQQETLNELWELDGYIKIFLRYINRTPYLHIDSELDYRAPVFSELTATDSLILTQESESEGPIAPDELRSFKFKQLRRVISKQMHYFDHPLFGMVVQIRRHQKPTRPDSPDADL